MHDWQIKSDYILRKNNSEQGLNNNSDSDTSWKCTNENTQWTTLNVQFLTNHKPTDEEFNTALKAWSLRQSVDTC